VLWTTAPLVFHALPEATRLEITRKFLGPAPGWFVRSQIENHVKVQRSANIISATGDDRYATLHFDRAASDGRRESTSLEVDHVLAATGYKVNMNKLDFLDPAVRADLRVEDGAPVLSRTFESTVPGLFFTGPTAAFAFGPLLRFACGAGFAAQRLTRRLA
jgi:thioredoxin reductase